MEERGDRFGVDGPVRLRDVLVQWGRIGCIGFGGPPTHIALLRELCVQRRRWLSPSEFEDGIAACNLLPGPASTQLAIFCAWRVAGASGAIVGGVAFIVPGLVVVLALASVFLASSPPTWVLGAGAGAGAAVAAVAVSAGLGLLPSSWRRTSQPHWRWITYALIGGVAAATIGALVVIALLGCGVIELGVRRLGRDQPVGLHAGPLAIAAAVPVTGGVLALAWVAFKVGALSYGGGFVIIPLMQSDAVHHYHWMTNTQFLDAVALGQVTPGPVVQTVAVVGYAAAGIVGGLLAALIAFSPSFVFVLGGAPRFDALRHNVTVRAFLDGAGPAAIGAIIGVAIPLTLALREAWQLGVLAATALSLLALRRGVVLTLLLAAAAGILAAQLGAPLR
jgi:chromate transporter